MATEHYFSVENRSEAERLRGQQNLMMNFDFPIYEKYLKGRKGLNILDIGCNNGRYAMMRLEKFPGIIGNYVGIEYDEKTVEFARSTYGSKNITFNCMDVTCDDFCDKVRAIMKQQGIESFDVIMMSLVMLHLKDKDGAARKIRSLMSEDTVFILADVDDGMNIMNPDPEGHMKMVNRIMEKSPVSGSRHFGRRIPEVFGKAGFKDIVLEKMIITTVGMNRAEREEFFILFDHLSDMANITDENYMVEEKEWLENKLEDFRDTFMDPATVVNFGFVLFSLRI